MFDWGQEFDLNVTFLTLLGFTSFHVTGLQVHITYASAGLAVQGHTSKLYVVITNPL